MGKFRTNSRHQLKLENFSIGSIISAGNDNWIVVEKEKGAVALLCTQTWKVSDTSVYVVDPNWITQIEAGDIAMLTGLNYTRSDFDYEEKGLKK